MTERTAYANAEKLAEEVKGAVGRHLPSAEAAALGNVLDLYVSTIRELDERLDALEQRVGSISEEPKPVGEDGPALRG
ncbi:BAR domain-containing protein [Methylobacterium planeticum]|uniref:Uncharacterized protein n=1 Tax=Methylobacterium planeticum TaxID=2615211 RepID=A0A6N6MEX1_9HYPH|nr:hypothetical protein [Methylobacterium planeticum]KAB1068824.1 hypothetical protein F6X51_26275 [Methylobacterium planeticum]